MSYVDPFGLSPMSGQSGTNFAHTVLGFLSCIPGPFGMIASAIDAGVYAFVDKDYAMAALCMVDVVTFGMGKVATGMIKAGKMTKTATALLKTSSMISNTVNFAVNVNAGANMAYGMYDKYIVQGHEFDSSTGWEILGLGLSVIGGVSSARGMTKDARHLGNLLSDADFTGGMKKELTQFASGVKDSFSKKFGNNKGHTLEFNLQFFGGGSSTGSKKYYQVTSKENAQALISSANPVLKGQEFREVYVWTVQPTLEQAQNSGARYLDTVIEFETSATFSRDTSMDDSSLWDIAMISDRPGPISISNVKEVGFKKTKRWWQFWKK